MRKVFVTGATGYVGSAIVARLVRAGLDVHALTRSAESARRLQAGGARPVIGSLLEGHGIVSELKNCDAVVHAAIDEGDSEAADQAALELIRTASEDGRVRRLLYTSGVWVHGDTGGAVVDETSPLAAAGPARWRPAHERAALDLAEAEVLTVVLRPGLAYGGRGGILGAWFQEAHERGTVTFPGDGSQHWGLVHREDMAEGYALALEHALGAECYLLVDESRHTVRELAEAVAAATGARAIADDAPGRERSLSPSDHAKRMDQRFTAARARRELGWVPRHASFVAEARALYDEWQRCAQAVG
jgi:nucleoside-diphosphate-sugar epimerase